MYRGGRDLTGEFHDHDGDLNRVTLTGDDPAENVSMELTARQCRREYGDGLHLPGKYTREYDWGTVEIVITDYSFGIGN